MATSESTPKINGRKLFDDIEAALRYFLVLKPAQYLAVSLWIIFTWVFHAEISPRLHFRSPEKRCGKSTALKVLSTHCTACISVCPTKALDVKRANMEVSFKRDKCIACELCIPVCPYQAMEILF